MNYKKLISFFTLAVVFSASTACSSLGVNPWERDILAKPEMELSADAIDLSLDDHIYFSKEGASGGRAFAGGGCGCN